MRNQRIAIIGCGNIGSRHLQAIAKLQGQISVEVVEPSKDAQKVAKSRLEEIPYEKSNFDIVWHESMQSLRSESDLTIVATTAVGRVEIIQKLLEAGHSRFLIEKVVCQSVEQYKQLLRDMSSFNAKGWVNTNRRYFEFYRKIKEYFWNPGAILLSNTSGNDGLGCNAIHTVDLFSWFSESYEIRLNGEHLINELFVNKRGTDLKEFAGTIIGSSKDNSVLALTYLPYKALPHTYTIVGDGKHLVIDETNEKVLILQGAEEIDNIEFRFEHASALTTKIAGDILETDNCMLPTLKDSSYAHYELFRIFNAHIRKVIGEEMVFCPIT